MEGIDWGFAVTIPEKAYAAIKSSPHPLAMWEIAELIDVLPSSLSRVLFRLHQEGKVERTMEEGRARDGSKAAYVYAFRMSEVRRKRRDPLPGDRDVDEAIERTRRKWRKGELFTRDEIAAYREKYGRMRSHGVIRK